MKQKEIANRLGISKSYLSMILKGQRKLTPQLSEKLQRVPEVHRFVNTLNLEFASHARSHWFKSSTAHQRSLLLNHFHLPFFEYDPGSIDSRCDVF